MASETSGLQVLAEAVARIEHKLDQLLVATGAGAGVHPQMHFVGQSCPICKMPIDYQIDINHNVVVRKCGCKSGKVPAAIPLSTLIPGVTDAPRSPAVPAAEHPAEHEGR
jgi:hypothetical protein